MKLQIVDLMRDERMALLNCHSKAASDFLKAGLPVRCKKGCFACCYRKVLLTIPEAFLLYHHLLQKKLWVGVKEKIKKVDLELWELSDEDYESLKIPCVILSDKGLCTGYKYRPAVCGTMASLSDPKACDPHYPGRIEKTIVNNVVAMRSFYEILAQKGYDIRRIRPLPVALLEAEALQFREYEDLDSLLRELGTVQ